MSEYNDQELGQELPILAKLRTYTGNQRAAGKPQNQTFLFYIEWVLHRPVPFVYQQSVNGGNFAISELIDGCVRAHSFWCGKDYRMPREDPEVIGMIPAHIGDMETCIGVVAAGTAYIS